MNDQEAFDRVATHIFVQGEPAIFDGRCVYRTPQGLRCAIGVLIPDNQYDPMMEGKSVQEIAEKAKWFGDIFAGLSLYFLEPLQNIHDAYYGWHSTENMRFELKAIALAFDLSPAILSTLSFKDR